jgi:GNAT superfamily N-acetyltransferase
MALRPATDSDVAIMMEIRIGVQENMLSRHELEQLGITNETLAAMLKSSHAGFCYEDNGRVVGFSMADERDGSIFALFIERSVEGRGIGIQLLNAAVDALVAAGHSRLKLTTEADTRAFAFYLRHGWMHTGFAANGDATMEFFART